MNYLMAIPSLLAVIFLYVIIEKKSIKKTEKISYYIFLFIMLYLLATFNH
jgi:hypothetical protein